MNMKETTGLLKFLNRKKERRVEKNSLFFLLFCWGFVIIDKALRYSRRENKQWERRLR